jgi:hypothetical protein
MIIQRVQCTRYEKTQEVHVKKDSDILCRISQADHKIWDSSDAMIDRYLLLGESSSWTRFLSKSQMHFAEPLEGLQDTKLPKLCELSHA